MRVRMWTTVAVMAVLGGCSAQQLSQVTGYINSGKAIVRNVNGAMPKACASVAAIAGDVGNGAAQAAAANPNNTQVQNVAAKVQNGAALAPTDCTTIAAALAQP